IDLPPSVHVTSKEGVMCKLRKPLYELKHSPKAWFGRFAASMKKFGYVQSNSDYILFLERHRGKLATLIIYVDDMIVTGDDQAKMQNLQKYLTSKFEMKSLGDLKYFLRIEVARSRHGIFLSQRKYVLDLLAETVMLDCKPIDTPSEQNHKLMLYPDQVPTDKERYQRLVGKLIYLAHTCPTITYAVSVMSQFMHFSSEDHMGVVICILRYLKVTLGNRLMFSKYGHTDVEGYTDTDWAGLKPMDLYCNNKAAIAIAHNPMQHDRTKHVEVDRHFIKEKLDAEIIYFPYISSEYQLANVFTKAVFTTIFLNSLDKLGMLDIFAPT
ncbi:unnamed protein product, partial [Prunus brigantina]